MPEGQRNRVSTLIVRSDQPLIGIISETDGEEMVHYFTDEAEVDAATPPANMQRALSLLGAWSDLDWEEALDELDRIRHVVPPTPPIDL